MLRLKAEMKLPGRAWLEFDLEDDIIETVESATLLTITAIYEPLGVTGRLYWLVLYPFHLVIFRKMLKEIKAAACPPEGVPL